MRLFSKTKLIIFSIILSLMLPSLCFADEVDDKRHEQNEIIQTINLRQAELDQLSNDYTAAILEKEQTEKDLNSLKKEIDVLDKKIKRNKEKLTQQCKNTYKTDEITMLDVILNSSNFENLISNTDFCSRFINQTNNTVNELKDLKTENEIKKKEQEEKQKELDNIIQEIEKSKELAATCIEDLENQYANLDEEIAIIILEQQIAENQRIAAEAGQWLIEGDAAAYIYANNENYQWNSENAQLGATTWSSSSSSFGSDSDVVNRAYAMLGSPYEWGGTTSSGFDCSGFVSYCLTGQEGTRLGTTGTFMGWTQTNNPQPGDICVNSGHTGIYVGDGNMIHASTYGIGVVEGPVQDGMIYVTYSG